MPPQPQLNEKTWFIRDTETDPSAKNSLLATYLDGVWNDLEIVRIDRIEIGDSGWLATYRVKARSRGRSRSTGGRQ